MGEWREGQEGMVGWRGMREGGAGEKWLEGMEADSRREMVGGKWQEGGAGGRW